MSCVYIDAPIFLFIHGGYWQEFSKDQAGFAVPNLVAHGIKVIVAGYDLCPNVKLTDIVREIKQLVQRVLALAHSSGSEYVYRTEAASNDAVLMTIKTT